MTIVLEASQGAATPLPVKLFSAKDIGELVLQRVGAYTTMDSGADPVELARTLEWMDIVVADLAGREDCQWLRPATITFELDDDGTNPYVLADAMGSSYPSLGISSVISAKVIDSNGVERDVDIIRRDEYEQIVKKTDSGTPNRIYIDRLNGQDNLFTYPVYSDTSNTMSMKLVVWTYPRSVLGPIPEQELSGQVAHGFDRTWQLWLVVATAVQVGDGPVRRMSERKLSTWRAEMASLEAQLMAHQNREKISLNQRRTRRRDW